MRNQPVGGKSPIYKVLDEQGDTLDSKYELGEGFIILHSSTGSKVGSPGTNTDYAQALHEIIKRLNVAGFVISDALVESLKGPLTGVPEVQRRIIDLGNMPKNPKDLAEDMRKRMRNVGSGRATPTGNSCRRIRIKISSASLAELKSVLSAKSLLKIDELSLSPEDIGWAEGRPQLVMHLRRERDAGLPQKKRDAFKREHDGRLFCEFCQFDPIAAYGEFGESCIEVHHTIPVQDMVEGHETYLKDLKCLCANCHRVAHRHMREPDSSQFKGSTTVRPVVS